MIKKIGLSCSKKESVNFLFQSPEIILSVTFLILCIAGSVLLVLPISGNLSYLNALFTSTSAVCVTGLSVVDSANDLTDLGQLFLLLLIQAGGLGIMSITSIVYILLGKRMSVKQEKNARSIFDVESKEEIKESLYLIFKYTFILEAIGAVILTSRFTAIENNFFVGLKQGVFTAVSAFCNAGFVLKTNNLIPYSNDGIILYTIAFLIIFGGIAPAIAILLPKFLKRQKLPPLATIVFNTTLILLIFGTIVFLIAEYNGVLSGMSLADKINNAWLQSVTTRTAGFNSVDLTNISGISYILFIILMIIGGSPGGTAGGIKVTALGIMIISCWNTLLGKSNIIRNRAIQVETIQKAITLIIVYLSFLMIAVFVLITTQSISDKLLIFEATSAIGTVGLTIGATPLLDEFGKIVIIIVMFFGRVAPATLICYLNTRSIETGLSYPDAKISLT